MNDELELSRRQLDVATSRLHAETLDAETAALSEAFRTFGQAAEQTAAEIDETALIERLHTVLLEPSSSPKAKPAPHGERSIWPLLLSGALAASTLIATVQVAATWSTQEPQAAVAPNLEAASKARVVASATNAASATAEAAISEQPYVPWHDELDDQIIAAQGVLAGVAGKPTSLDGSLSSIDEQLDAMASDLTEGSL